MDIWSGLPPEQQQAIVFGEEALSVIDKCETVEHWYHVGNALIAMQQAAMSFAHTNKPTGRGYSTAWALFAGKAPKLKDMAKSDRSDAVWLATNWPTVKPWLDTLPLSGTKGQTGKRQFNHPRSVKRKYDAAHKVPNAADVQCAEAIAEAQEQIIALNMQINEAAALNDQELVAQLTKLRTDQEQELDSLQASGVKPDKATRIELQDTITKLQERLDVKDGIKKGLLKPGTPVETLVDLIDSAYKPETMRKLVKALNDRIKEAEKWEAMGKGK